jgi:hypothetical protein
VPVDIVRPSSARVGRVCTGLYGRPPAVHRNLVEYARIWGRTAPTLRDCRATAPTPASVMPVRAENSRAASVSRAPGRARASARPAAGLLPLFPALRASPSPWDRRDESAVTVRVLRVVPGLFNFKHANWPCTGTSWSGRTFTGGVGEHDGRRPPGRKSPRFFSGARTARGKEREGPEGRGWGELPSFCPHGSAFIPSSAGRRQRPAQTCHTRSRHRSGQQILRVHRRVICAVRHRLAGIPCAPLPAARHRAPDSAAGHRVRRWDGTWKSQQDQKDQQNQTDQKNQRKPEGHPV